MLDSWLAAIGFALGARFATFLLLMIYQDIEGYEGTLLGKEKDYFNQRRKDATSKTLWIATVAGLVFGLVRYEHYYVMFGVLIVNYFVWEFYWYYWPQRRR